MAPSTRPPDPLAFAALERAMIEDLAHAATPALGLRLGTIAPAVVLTSRGSPHLLINRVLVHDVSTALGGAAVQMLLARAHVPDRSDNFVVALWPQARTSTLAEELVERGLVPFRRDWCVLARDAARSPVVDTRFRIARAAKRDGVAFAEVIAEGLGLSALETPLVLALVERAGWHAYLAWDGPRPIAAAVLFVHGRAGMLAWAATRASHRGGSAHDGLIARRIQVASALGCEIVFAETGTPIATEPSPGLANLEAAGFSTVARRRCFVPPGTTWTGR